MGQSKKMSLAETVTSTAIGYAVALVTQALVYPLFDIQATGGEHVTIAAIFTVVSLVRGYAVRRWFNRSAQTVRAVQSRGVLYINERGQADRVCMLSGDHVEIFGSPWQRVIRPYLQGPCKPGAYPFRVYAIDLGGECYADTAVTFSWSPFEMKDPPRE